MSLKDHIRGIPNFPKPGILFYDIATLLRNGPAFKEAIEQLTEAVAKHKPDRLIGIESRGFLVAAPVAYALGCGFVMKPVWLAPGARCVELGTWVFMLYRSCCLSGILYGMLEMP